MGGGGGLGDEVVGGGVGGLGGGWRKGVREGVREGGRTAREGWMTRTGRN